MLSYLHASLCKLLLARAGGGLSNEEGRKGVNYQGLASRVLHSEA